MAQQGDGSRPRFSRTIRGSFCERKSSWAVLLQCSVNSSCLPTGQHVYHMFHQQRLLLVAIEKKANHFSRYSIIDDVRWNGTYPMQMWSITAEKWHQAAAIDRPTIPSPANVFISCLLNLSSTQPFLMLSLPNPLSNINLLITYII